MDLKKALLYLCFVTLLAGALPMLAAAETWQVNPSMRFDLANNTLTFTDTGGWMVTLYRSGDWAVCGTVDGTALTRDPYGSLVYNAQRTGGTIQWAAGTPVGYTCDLLLGYRFAGDGAEAHSSYCTEMDWPYGSHEVYYDTAIGTLVDGLAAPNMAGGYDWSYSAVSHSFSVTYVPEPSPIVALGSGLLVLGGMIRRRRK